MRLVGKLAGNPLAFSHLNVGSWTLFAVSLLWASKQNEGFTCFPATEANIQHQEFTVKATIREIHLAEPNACLFISIRRCFSHARSPNFGIHLEFNDKMSKCRLEFPKTTDLLECRSVIFGSRCGQAGIESTQVMYVVPVPKNVGPNQNSILWVHLKMSTGKKTSVSHFQP